MKVEGEKQPTLREDDPLAESLLMLRENRPSSLTDDDWSLVRDLESRRFAVVIGLSYPCFLSAIQIPNHMVFCSLFSLLGMVACLVVLRQGAEPAKKLREMLAYYGPQTVIELLSIGATADARRLQSFKSLFIKKFNDGTPTDYFDLLKGEVRCLRSLMAVYLTGLAFFCLGHESLMFVCLVLVGLHFIAWFRLHRARLVFEQHFPKHITILPAHA